MSLPGTGSMSPASKKTESPERSVPFSVVRFHASERRAARICGGASAAPLVTDEFSSYRIPRIASLGRCAEFEDSADMLRYWAYVGVRIGAKAGAPGRAR